MQLLLQRCEDLKEEKNSATKILLTQIRSQARELKETKEELNKSEQNNQKLRLELQKNILVNRIPQTPKGTRIISEPVLAQK
jgi:cellulose biosynthesis protein BcsQ